jgi:hypothetical protein
MTTDANSLVDAYFARWGAGDFDGLGALLADDFAFRGAIDSADGAAAFIALIQRNAPAFTGARFDGMRRVVQGDRAVSLYDLVMGDVRVPMAEAFEVRGVDHPPVSGRGLQEPHGARPETRTMADAGIGVGPSEGRTPSSGTSTGPAGLHLRATSLPRGSVGSLCSSTSLRWARGPSCAGDRAHPTPGSRSARRGPTC